MGSRPRPVPASYSRFLWYSIVGSLIPGVGLIAAKRRRTGIVVLTGFLLGVAAVVVYTVRAGTDGLVRLGTNPDRVNVVGYGLIAVAAVWLLIAMVSFFLLEPRGLGALRRLSAVVVVVVVTSAVLTPMGIGSRYAFTQRDFIHSVFPDELERHSLTVPETSTDEDPWAGEDRVNVLILGSDAGAGRQGTRTDTVMVASINTVTGDTALFSLPRNLQNVPFPEGELRDAYPDGFRGEPASEYWLYTIYKNIPAQFPEFFEGIKDPGAEAVKLAVSEALGLEIHYYVMVNLDGFQALVDALGGVVIDVPYPIPMGSQATAWGTCTEPRDWIEEGEQQRLNGDQALWFARARCGPPPISDDYERMRRQRCMIGAVAAQANPFTLLTRYLRLEKAVRDNISTDIGQRRLEDFAELALRVQDAQIRSLPFTNEIIQYYDPDFDLIREFVQESLDPPAPSPTEPPTDAPTTPGTNDGDTDADTDGDVTGNDDAAADESGDETGETGTDDGTGGLDESDGAQAIDEVC